MTHVDNAAALGSLIQDRRGAVSILFAATAIPLTMCVGLAVDFSFYIQAQSQLSLAADAGALHAVRIASQHFVKGESATQAGMDGANAGMQWFQAQLGPLVTGKVDPADINVPPVHFDQSSSTFTSTVSFKATIPTHFGNLFNAMLSWPLTGSSQAVITTNSFIQIDMLMDNSSSMLIGAQPSDIEALQNLTICPPTAIAVKTGHGGNNNLDAYSEYSWQFPAGVGFGKDGQKKQKDSPKKGNKGGNCNANYTGDPAECLDPPLLPGAVIAAGTNLPAGIARPVNDNGYCPTGFGSPDTVSSPQIIDSLTGLNRNLPQAPCGFACHSDVSPNDYYTLLQTARKLGATITLRFDVIQQAAALVVNNLITAEQNSGVLNQFTLGVFTFNSAISQVHPKTTGGPFLEADNQLAQGLADVQAISTPAVPDQANTDFQGAMSYLAKNVQPSGDGTTPTTPRKNLFIVTDGLEDYPPGGSRVIGQMTDPTNETVCQPLKDRGYTIYVLYTPYYPLPNPFYLDNGARTAVEQPVTSSTSVAAALQACATNPSYYYQASSAADINAAMAKMLASALNSPGRFKD